MLGIAGIALGQWLLSVAAIVLGFVARNREPGARLMANWGLVLGFVGVFGGILFGIIGFAAFAPLWLGGRLLAAGTSPTSACGTSGASSRS